MASEPDPQAHSGTDKSSARQVPPLLPAGVPPPAPGPTPHLPRGRRLLVLLLTIGFGLFLADAGVSFVDDSLIVLFNVHLLTLPREIVFLFALAAAFVIYVLMGFTRAVPKRLFLPVTLFSPIAGLAMVPFLIYAYRQLPHVQWVFSLCQVTLGLVILYRLQGRLTFTWPLVKVDRLGPAGFGWANLVLFLLANVLVLLPAVVAYLGVCGALAVGHFSEGFLTLRPSGFAVRIKTYVRGDGKTIELVPMAHIGERDFYQKVAQSFPTNGIILMEGVTDDRGLLTNSINYHRMAARLHLTEQQKEFKPTRGTVVSADIDVDQFAQSTIDFLNLVMLIHKKGLNTENVLRILQYSPPPNFDRQLLEDLLRKRNRRLLNEVQAQLPEADNLIVPWGVAHMPQIAEELQKAGFHFKELREYQVIRFGSAGR